MPRVTEEHLKARRRQILAAAEACFAREGFHRTTMQDIFREAGLSPGAVYRYFRSKEDIIAAIAAVKRERTRLLIDAIGQFGGSREVLGTLVETFFTPSEAEREGLDFALWAEASRNERVRGILAETVETHLGALAAIVRQGQERGELNPQLDPMQVARIFVALFQGFTLQKSLSPDLDPREYLQAAGALTEGLFSTVAKVS
jgi:AcrR family transcriptional regulator